MKEKQLFFVKNPVWVSPIADCGKNPTVEIKVWN